MVLMCLSITGKPTNKIDKELLECKDLNHNVYKSPSRAKIQRLFSNAELEKEAKKVNDNQGLGNDLNVSHILNLVMEDEDDAYPPPTHVSHHSKQLFKCIYCTYIQYYINTLDDKNGVLDTNKELINVGADVELYEDGDNNQLYGYNAREVKKQERVALQERKEAIFLQEITGFR